MKNYQCKKCGTVLQNAAMPTSSGCPSGSFHQWTDLGEVGQTNYQCRNCGVLIRTKNQPISSGCPSGSFHQWTRL